MTSVCNWLLVNSFSKTTCKKKRTGAALKAELKYKRCEVTDSTWELKHALKSDAVGTSCIALPEYFCKNNQSVMERATFLWKPLCSDAIISQYSRK